MSAQARPWQVSLQTMHGTESHGTESHGTESFQRMWYGCVLLTVVACLITGSLVRTAVFGGNGFCHELSYSDEALGVETRVLFVGSSHTYQGVDPRLIDVPAGNLGYPEANLSISKLLIEQHLNSLPSLELVVIQCEPWSFSLDSLSRQQFNYRTLLDQGVPLSKVPLSFEKKLVARLKTIAGLDFPAATPANIWSRQLLRSQWRGVPGFKPPWDGSRDEPPVAAASPEVEVRGDDGRGDDGRYMVELEAIESVIRDCKAQGIKVALIRFPHTAGYESAQDDRQWKDAMESLVDRQLIDRKAIWDFYDDRLVKFDDRLDFADTNHLHPQAIPKFCNALNRLISEMLVD